MAIHKTLEVFARIGFRDKIIPLKDVNNKSAYIVLCEDTYIVGYEDAKGNECEEDGVYLDQNYKG